MFLKINLRSLIKLLLLVFTSRNKTTVAIEHLNFNNELDYFTPEGRSLRLSFDRFPIKFTHVGSHFDPHRMHPILHRTRPHKGIDLAAKQGTPIHGSR